MFSYGFITFEKEEQAIKMQGKVILCPIYCSDYYDSTFIPYKLLSFTYLSVVLSLIKGCDLLAVFLNGSSIPIFFLMLFS